MTTETVTWADAPYINVRLLPPNTRIAGFTIRRFALMLGHSEAGVLIVEGTKGQLGLFVDSLHRALLADPHEDLALAVADRVANATDDSSDDGVNGNCNLIHRVAREVSLAVVTEFKTVGYLQFSRSGD